MIDGYHFDMKGDPKIHAIQAMFVHVDVTDPHGKPVKFVPWFGALAHAIFFHVGSLDYFHTHVCAPERAKLREHPGTDEDHRPLDRAGQDHARGAAARSSGTWRLFLQMKLHGRIVTAPFTLKVAS